jgi:hypothetical protein
MVLAEQPALLASCSALGVPSGSKVGQVMKCGSHSFGMSCGLWHQKREVPIYLILPRLRQSTARNIAGRVLVLKLKTLNKDEKKMDCS